MQKITFTNKNGDTIAFGNGFPFYLRNLSGVSAPIGIIQSSTGYKQQGAKFLGIRLAPRSISFDVGLRQPTQADVYNARRELIKAFNSVLGEGWFTYENDSVMFRIKAAATMGGDFNFSGDSKNLIGYQWANISLMASDPYFKDFATTTVKLEDLVGGLIFPCTFPISFARRGDHAFIEIIGDDSTPVLVEFRGPAQEPQITHINTGKTIKVNISLEEGEKLFINTEQGNKAVVFEDADGNQSSAFNDIDADSDFDQFELLVGENEISFSAVSGTPEVYITYSNRWVGC